MMRPPEIFETERLRLRRPVLEDARWIFDGYATDPDAVLYLAMTPPTELSQTEEFLTHCGVGRERGEAFAFAIESREDGQPVGMIEMRRAASRIELGYALQRSAWGQGFMPEAIRCLKNWALAQPEIARFWAVCDVDNVRSRRVLEKAGLAFEGTLRKWEVHPNVAPDARDCHCFAATRDQGVGDAVVLRDVVDSDLAIFFEQQRNEVAVRMAAFIARDPSDRPAFLAHWQRIRSDPTILTRTILLGEVVVGHVASFESSGDREVTYWVAREHWGRGVATRALAALLECDPVRPLSALAAADNAGSIRVLEKCGFKIVGEDRGFANGRGEEIAEVVMRLE